MNLIVTKQHLFVFYITFPTVPSVLQHSSKVWTHVQGYTSMINRHLVFFTVRVDWYAVSPTQSRSDPCFHLVTRTTLWTSRLTPLVSLDCVDWIDLISLNNSIRANFWYLYEPFFLHATKNERHSSRSTSTSNNTTSIHTGIAVQYFYQNKQYQQEQQNHRIICNSQTLYSRKEDESNDKDEDGKQDQWWHHRSFYDRKRTTTTREIQFQD